MTPVFYLLAALWTGWLCLEGFLSGEVWVKGGAKDRFTRSLDMHSFAHKVSRESSPFTYWFNLCFYFVAAVILLVTLVIT